MNKKRRSQAHRLLRDKTMAYFCTCTSLLTSQFAKEIKKLPDTNTHSIVKLNYVKKIEKKKKKYTI